MVKVIVIKAAEGITIGDCPRPCCSAPDSF